MISDVDPPVTTEDELHVEDGADPPPDAEVQDDGEDPKPDQEPEEEDDS